MDSMLPDVKLIARRARHTSGAWTSPLILPGAIILFSALSANAQISSNNPSQILQQYRSFRTTWLTNIWPYANTLFALLAVIEFAWSAAVMALEKTDLQSWTSALIRKIMWLGAFYALVLYGRQWIPAIIDSFSQLGGSAAGINGKSRPLAFRRVHARAEYRRRSDGRR